MRFHGLLLLCLGSSFITTAHSSALFNQQSDQVLFSSPEEVHCPPGSDTVQSIPTIQQVSTSLFRNQYQVKKAAYGRGGYYMAKWDPKESKWAISLEKIDNDLPDNISFAADHIFEIQMLTIWMNYRGKDSSFFGSKLDDIKAIINGSPNGAWITTELNCWKAAVVPDIMKNALASNTCKNIDQSSLTAYITATQDDLVAVIKGITSIIEKVSSTPDAKDFFQVASKAIECLMGVSKVL